MASAACPAPLPAEVGACPAKVRKLLELQELNPPALLVPAWLAAALKMYRSFTLVQSRSKTSPRVLAGWCPQTDLGPVCGDADAGLRNQRHSHCEQKGVLAVAPMKTRSGFLVRC